jgi:tungstate transport system ATP-binding protein
MNDDIRRRQAMVFQRSVLLRRSVADNIGFVLHLRGADSPARRLAILERAGLAAHANQPARLLSGGEQQRLALARALALNPEVLLLDEPTASLDPGSMAIIEDTVKSAHAGGTKVLFVTHDVGQARRLADEVIFLHRGRVAEQTPADRFFDRPESQPAQDYVAGRIVR